MKPLLSSLLANHEMAIMAILPSALNEWVERALTEHGIPELLAMAGIGSAPAAARETPDAAREKARTRAEARRSAMDSGDMLISGDHGIAVLTLEGVMSPYYAGAADPRGIAATVRQLGADPGIRTIILDIDSPGGHATHIRELGQTIRAVSEAGTRTVAHVGPGAMAASAAYWTAASADEIYGATSSMPGSIGVFSALYEFSGLLGKLGVTLQLFRDGSLKGMGLFGKSLTADESAHIQAGVDKVSAEFKSFVRARRPGISDATMQGQVFDGDAAIDARLLDGHVDDLYDLLAIEIDR